MNMLLTRKELKSRDLGPLRKQKSIALDLHHYIGDELPELRSPRQCLVQFDYDDNVAFVLK